MELTNSAIWHFVERRVRGDQEKIYMEEGRQKREQYVELRIFKFESKCGTHTAPIQSDVCIPHNIAHKKEMTRFIYI